MKECVAIISQEDCDMMLGLYKRTCVLKRLRRIQSEHGLEEAKAVNSDLMEAEQEIERLWTMLADKYNLKKCPKAKWTVDFYKNKILLID